MKNVNTMNDWINNDMPLRVLSLEDSVNDFEIIKAQLCDAGYKLNITRVDKESDFTFALQNNQYDIILADFHLPGFDPYEALRLALEICPEIPFICVSGSIGEEAAIEFIKQGAVDYVLKDRLVRLPFSIKRALAEAKEKEVRRQAENALRIKMKELELFHTVTIGRELRMIELKKEVNELMILLGKEEKYKIVE
jgi:DNA-binding NtrC family response regulator